MKVEATKAEEIWEALKSSAPAAKAMLAAVPSAHQGAVRAGIEKIIRREHLRIETDHSEVTAKLAYLKAVQPEFDYLHEWRELPMVLDRPGASCLHHARQAFAERKAYVLGAKMDLELKDYSEALNAANCFVVEHDWAKAFNGATDFDSGDIRLPYEVCAFDFKISGRRVVALVTTAPDSSDILMQIMVRGREFWLIDDDICRHQNGAWVPIMGGRTADRNLMQSLTEFIGLQIRAITVALDAQVADTEVVRVSEKLAKARVKSGHVPPKPYHIVSLARRAARAAPLASIGGDGEHTKRRLHFRRGHWRHYEDHKTWIRWMLVGDPDLGFVEKEYRL